MGKKVLVIDNDPAILEVLTDTLTYEGFEVATFTGTADVVSLAHQQKPDLIILDYLLNGINGGELCGQLKAAAITSHLPVILFSAYPQAYHPLNPYHCDYFIAKPFDLADFIGRINFCISNSLIH